MIVTSAIDFKYKLLLLFTLLSTFSLITLGGIVRVTESGLGCPDWPLCHGQIIPPAEMDVLIEYSHRLTASFVGVLVMIAMILGWIRYRYVKLIVIPVGLSFTLVLVQVVLGGITVLSELRNEIVTIHLLMGELIMGCLVIGSVFSFQSTICTFDYRRTWFWLAVGGIVIALAIIVSGSYIVGIGAGPVCTSWPLCMDDWLPEHQLMWAHMVHRLVAVLGGAIILGLAVVVGLKYRQDTYMLIATISTVILVILQVVIGAGNVWFNFSPIIRVLHLSLATMLLIGLVMIAIRMGLEPKAEAEIE